MIDSNLAVLLGWMGCHNKDPGVSGTSSGSVLGTGLVFGGLVSLSTTSSINWVCSNDSIDGYNIIKNLFRKRYFHNISISIVNLYRKQNYLPNILDRNNAFKIKIKPHVAINSLYVSINIT